MCMVCVGWCRRRCTGYISSGYVVVYTIMILIVMSHCACENVNRRYDQWTPHTQQTQGLDREEKKQRKCLNVQIAKKW